MDLITLCERAVSAKYKLPLLTTDEKNSALRAVADELEANTEYLIKQNNIDIDLGQAKGMHLGLQDRLKLTKDRISAMAEGLRQIADLPDCIGEVLEEFDRPNGLMLKKVRVPIGVIGIIFESRPNVTADAFGLCFKTSNVCILKGGSDAINSNKAIVKVIKDALEKIGVCQDAVLLIEDTDREVTRQFMKMNNYVDLLIPRGGAGLIKTVVENSTIPVIETGTGNCHIYVDKEADQDMALDIIFNAKTQRIGVCNACESLCVHKDIADEFLPKLYNRLSQKNVDMRLDVELSPILPDCKVADENDYATEYLDYIISVKRVNDVYEAIEHINKYNTKHSESIITENMDVAESFLNGVDAACVYVNASTRFTDGFEFGFGAEIGISTQKLHARGPMGLKELTSYKYKIYGNGQIRG